MKNGIENKPKKLESGYPTRTDKRTTEDTFGDPKDFDDAIENKIKGAPKKRKRMFRFETLGDEVSPVPG